MSFESRRRSRLSAKPRQSIESLLGGCIQSHKARGTLVGCLSNREGRSTLLVACGRAMRDIRAGREAQRSMERDREPGEG